MLFKKIPLHLSGGSLEGDLITKQRAQAELVSPDSDTPSGTGDTKHTRGCFQAVSGALWVLPQEQGEQQNLLRQL